MMNFYDNHKKSENDDNNNDNNNNNHKNMELSEKITNFHQPIHDKLDFFLENNKIPHIIFYGKSGTGKKTIVFEFVNKIYKNDKQRMKTNVMIVNCSQGKGIKFVREEIKVFAKTNVQLNAGTYFKTIVLLNADCLTIDAQSALRRCIELFSHNTRFFLIVENKNKLLNPILSRFCEIYVPEYLHENKEFVNLHKLTTMNDNEHDDLEQISLIRENEKMIVNEFERLRTEKENVLAFFEVCDKLYDNGVSCLDIMDCVKKDKIKFLNKTQKTNSLMKFYQVKSLYRCEKMIIIFMLHNIFSSVYECDTHSSQQSQLSTPTPTVIELKKTKQNKQPAKRKTKNS